MSLKDRFRALRSHQALSARNMSLKIGGSESLWTQYETGRKEPSLAVLSELNRLGYSIDWLLSGAGSMTVGSVVPTPTVQPADSDRHIAELCAALERVFADDPTERLYLWATILEVVDRSGGSPLEPLVAALQHAITPEQLRAELDFLEKEGIISHSKGVFRLLKQSLDFHNADAGLQVLLAIRDLLQKHYPRDGEMHRK